MNKLNFDALMLDVNHFLYDVGDNINVDIM